LQHFSRHSQNAWICSQHCLSPLVQVMEQPSLVFSHLQLANAKLHWQQQTPFLQQQHEQQPSHSMRQRFCSAPQATSSSHLQRILQPSCVFSNLIVQRGTTFQFENVGVGLGNDPGCHDVCGPYCGATTAVAHSNRLEAAIKDSFLAAVLARASL
jgi:hypothetical protein